MRAKMICRVCGKEYEACLSQVPASTTFRWQEVACSPACGEIYLKQILRSRGELAGEAKGESKPEKAEKLAQKKSKKVITPEPSDGSEL